MRRPAVVVVLSLLCLGMLVAAGLAYPHGADASRQSGTSSGSIVISNDAGELARVPLNGDTFAVSYRNSIYGTRAEERYAVQPDGTYRLVQIAADQLAVLEEYYAVPGAPVPADPTDRREWVVEPDPAHPAEFTALSLAATNLGERTLHVPGSPPLELWTLVNDRKPFIVLHLEETP